MQCPQVRVTLPEQMQRMGREGAGWGRTQGAVAFTGLREVGGLQQRAVPHFPHQRLQGGQRDEDSDLTLLLAFRRALVTLGRCDADVETRFTAV